MPGVSVIERELREAARQPQTYWLRVGGVAAAILVLALTTTFVSGNQTSPTAFARWIFINLQTLVFASIWLVAPFLTGDALSRERREGTLGLLFLTPLRPFEVVVGKGMAQAVRTMSLLLGVVPVMSVPLMLGGLSGQELFLALTADLMSLALALAAGLLASAFSRQFMRAMAATVLVTSLCLVGLSLVYHTTLTHAFGVRWGSDLWGRGLEGIVFLSGAADCWRQMAFQVGLLGGRGGAVAGFSMTRWCVVNAGVMLGALVVVGAMVTLAAARTRRATWDSGRGLLPDRVEKVLTQPMLWTQWLRSHMRRSLTRNPVGWLHERRAWSRIVKWGWCALVAVLGSILVSAGSWYALPWALTLLGVALVAGLAFTASSGFKGEQESGLLELLLVTPLNEWQLIIGRLRGLWSQFLPSVVLLAAAMLQLRSMRTWPYTEGGFILCEVACWCLLASLLLVPCVGLAMSVTGLGAVSAWVATLAAGVLGPLCAGTLLWLGLLAGYLPPGADLSDVLADNLVGRGGWQGQPDSSRAGLWLWMASVVALQAVAAVVCLAGLFHRLRTRHFLGA